MFQRLTAKARESFLRASSRYDEENVSQSNGLNLENVTQVKEKELEILYEKFLLLEKSLSKYSKTCSGFAEVTGLLREGLDQLTGQVLSFCSLIEEDEPLSKLEKDAMEVRNKMGCEDELLCKLISEHLIEPIGVRLRNFEEIKNKMKERRRLKKKYEKLRREVGSLRANRDRDEDRLFEAEKNLSSVQEEIKTITHPLYHDLSRLHTDRAKVLAEPYFALKRCQCEFLEHLHKVLQNQDSMFAEEFSTTDDFSINSEIHPETTLTARTNNTNTVSSNLISEFRTRHGALTDVETVSTKQRFACYDTDRYEYDTDCTDCTPGSISGTRRQRHLVADYVRDYRRHKGGPIFKRPDKFKGVKIEPGLKAKSSCPTVYEKVQKLCASIRKNQIIMSNQGDTDEDVDVQTKASKILQKFWRVIKAQMELRQLAQNKIDICLDKETGYKYYVNRTTGVSSWIRPWTLGSSI